MNKAILQKIVFCLKILNKVKTDGQKHFDHRFLAD